MFWETATITTIALTTISLTPIIAYKNKFQLSILIATLHLIETLICTHIPQNQPATATALTLTSASLPMLLLLHLAKHRTTKPNPTLTPTLTLALIIYIISTSLAASYNAIPPEIGATYILTTTLLTSIITIYTYTKKLTKIIQI
ncbi:MAG: hypothetical protein QXT64_06695 [Desulfurococcaceae archaeon]